MIRIAAACIAVLFFATFANASGGKLARGNKSIVDAVIRPIMARDHIAGMAVGIIQNGQTYILNYGVASTQTGRPVTNATLFEIGSISKTFTATLASYAQLNHSLSLSDTTSRYLPALRGSKFGEVTLLSLGTHTPGGLPLQVPDTIRSDEELIQYFKAWMPTYAQGTYRTYSNPGIGTLGLITAKSMHGDFANLIEAHIFAVLGMRHSFYNVPDATMPDYAQGYTKSGEPVRVTPGELSAETYGIKTNASDMLRFLEANISSTVPDTMLQRAIIGTHTGYFQVGAMTQDLIWEQYPYPVTLKALLSGNSAEVIFDPTPVQRKRPPEKPQTYVWINKTGSTNGFGAYVAFIPQKRLGIVILANKNFPIHERVSAAYAILTALADPAVQARLHP